jgi:predicted DNA-binding transcriptional regulator YafY
MNLPYGDSINLVMRLYGRAADHLYETPVNETQILKEIEPGITELRVQVQNTEELKWWILGLGANVEVLKPAKIRKDISLELKRAVNHYP